jgi:hypothetical protein
MVKMDHAERQRSIGRGVRQEADPERVRVAVNALFSGLFQ